MFIKEVKHVPSEGKSVIYVQIEGETLYQNLLNRRGRPYTAFRKLILANPNVTLPAGSKLSWSQTAGCSCGCSPGFFIQTEWGAAYGNDIFVTVQE